MRIDERQQFEILDRMTHEGYPELLVGPISRPPPDLPSLWREALVAEDPTEIIASLWAPIAHHLPRVCQALDERLLGVGLLHTEKVPTGLLYFFGVEDNLFVYRGRPPAREYQLEVSPLPPEFLDFYRIHNGWVLDFDEDEGPLPIDQWDVPELLWKESRLKPLPGSRSLSEITVIFKSDEDLAFAFDVSSQPPVPMLLSPPATAEALFDIWIAIDDHVSRFLSGFNRVRAATRSADVLASQYDAQLAAVSARARDLRNLAGSAAHRQWCRLLLERASVELAASPKGTLNGFHRESLEQGCTAIERSSFVEAGELLALFSLAQALGENGAARFLASVPPKLWLTDSPGSLQVNALFQLFFGQLEKAALSIEQAIANLPENTTGAGIQSLVPRLIAALVQRDWTSFETYRALILREGTPGADEDGINLPWSIRLFAFEAASRRIGLKGSE